jgi:hypothetical protein
MGLSAVSFHFWGVVMLSLGCAPCAIRQTSSQASRCLSCVGCGLVSRVGFCKVRIFGSAHARHMLIGRALMALTSCVCMLWGSAGFCSVFSCRVLWFRFDPLSGAGSFVVWVGFLGRVVRLWVRGLSRVAVWCGVSGNDVVVFQSGSCLGVLHSLRSSVMILQYIFVGVAWLV